MNTFYRADKLFWRVIIVTSVFTHALLTETDRD